MTALHADQLIDGYLARLRVAGADLPAAQLDELMVDMRTHIAEARARQADETDASILNILDRLGDPAMVVSAARERAEPGPSSPRRPPLTLGDSFRRYARTPMLGCSAALVALIAVMAFAEGLRIGHLWILFIVLEFWTLVAVLVIWVARALLDRTG